MMILPAIPENEEARISALHAYRILDTLPEQQFDSIVRLAADICDTSISLISLVDSDRCWFKAKVGLDQVLEAPRRIAYAAHAINSPTEQMVIEDALTDSRFCDCPLVTGTPSMRFYVGTPLVDPDGFVLGTLCVIDKEPRQLSEQQLRMLRILAEQTVDRIRLRIELSRRESINRELATKNEELEQYASVISHDLKHPLRTIRGFLTLLIEEHLADLEEEAQQYISLIDNTASHMQSMIDNMLCYARIGTERIRTHVNLDTLVDEICADLHHLITESRATITYDGLPVVPGFAPEIRQLLQNLISNGLKFVAADVAPHIIITAQDLPQHWRVSISDNGIGIPPNRQQRIFRLFERLHHEKTYAGHGIGLAFCSKIVKLHGGEIGVRNNEAGGSTFWFTLPKELADAQMAVA